MRSKRKDERISFRQAIVLTQANDLTVETYPTNAAYLLNKFEANGQTFVFKDFQKNTTERGKLTPDIFEKFFSIPLSINELLAILTGKVADNWLNSGLLISSDAGQVSFATSEKTLSFQLDSKAQKLAKFSKYGSFAKSLTFTGTYLNWQEFEGKQIPQMLSLSLPRYDMEISITVKPLALN